jgi:hypothetical protein
MTVYELVEDHQHPGGFTSSIGLFSTRERAEQELAKHKFGDPFSGRPYPAFGDYPRVRYEPWVRDLSKLKAHIVEGFEALRGRTYVFRQILQKVFRGIALEAWDAAKKDPRFSDTFCGFDTVNQAQLDEFRSRVLEVAEKQFRRRTGLPEMEEHPPLYRFGKAPDGKFRLCDDRYYVRERMVVD